MTAIRNAMQKEVSQPQVLSWMTPAQIWITLTDAKKNKAVELFRHSVKQMAQSTISVDSTDAEIDDSNRIESFFFGGISQGDFVNITVLKESVTVHRTVSDCDVTFTPQHTECMAQMSHTLDMPNPVTGQGERYTSKVWLTQEGFYALMLALSRSVAAPRYF